MSVLLSIKPDYIEKIFSEQKKFEFRKKIWKREKNIKRVYLYATAPIKKVVGFFIINKILKGNPKRLWSLCKSNAGMSQSDFFKYFNGCSKGYAIAIKKAIKYDTPLEKKTLIGTHNAPQNFMYVSNIFLTKIKERGFEIAKLE